MSSKGQPWSGQGPGETRPDRKSWLTLFVLSLALAIVIIDVTIVNVTIPTIRAEFNAGLHEVEWISALYALVYAAFIITWGKLGDQFGRRRMFIAGVAVFIVGSLITGIAPSIPIIIVGRFVQAMGAAMTSPSTLSLLSSTFTGRMRGVAFGVWGATAGAAGALGPLLGGFLTTYFSWRWAFLINLPIGIAAIVGALLVIKESSDAGHKHDIDIPGVTLVTVGLGSLVFALIEGQAHGWWTPTDPFELGGLTWPLTTIAITPFLFALAAISLAAFVMYELRVERAGKEPLFPFSLLRFKGFRYGLMTVLIVALGEFGILFVMPIYLQGVRGLSAFETGVILLPFAIANFVFAPLAGMLSARFSPKWVVTAGMVCEAIAIFLLSRIIAVDTAFIVFVPVLVLYGAGVGMAIAQLTNLTLSDIPREQVGVGSGANNTVRQIGAAVGVAVLGAIFASQIASVGRAELSASVQVPPQAKPAIERALDSGLSESAPTTGPGQGPAGAANSPVGLAITQIFDDAIAEGARSAAVFAAIFVLFGALSSVLIPTPRSHRVEQIEPVVVD
ncbi:MAG: MFS transporter [Anaerolineae bacterium]